MTSTAKNMDGYEKAAILLLSLGEEVASGIYYDSIQAGSFSAMKKMVLLK